MKPTFKLHHILLLAVGLLSSCASLNSGPTTYKYAPAMAATAILYQPKPMSTDTSKTANYLAFGYSNDDGTKTSFSDQSERFALIYQRGHTFNSLAVGYGAYAFYGSYYNKTTTAGPSNGAKQVGDAFFNTKDYHGYGLQASTCFFTHADNIDFRFLGVELNYSNEAGDYYDYRKNASSVSYIYTDASSGLFKAGLTSEIIFHSHRKPSNQYGFRAYYGTSIGNHTYVNTNPSTAAGNNSSTYTDNAFAFSFYGQHSHYFLTLNVTGNDAAMFTLGYRF